MRFVFCFLEKQRIDRAPDRHRHAFAFLLKLNDRRFAGFLTFILCARPATQLTCSPLLPEDFTRQSIAHARKSMWKGSILFVSARRKGHSHGGQRKRTWWTTGRTRGRGFLVYILLLLSTVYKNETLKLLSPLPIWEQNHSYGDCAV